MKTWELASAQRALEGGWAALVLRETRLPWAVPVVPWTHPKGATVPQPFLAQLVAEGMLLAPVFWFEPRLSPEQAKGDLVHGDLVEWHARANTGTLPTLRVLGVVSSTGQVWCWPGPVEVAAGEDLAILARWA